MYQHLEKSGVLTHGTDKQIKAAKLEYRKKYQASWRNQQRHAFKEIAVTLTPDELRIISEAAKKHHRSKTRFLKEAALSYINKKYLVPDPITVLTIQEQLALHYSILQQIFEDNRVSWDIGKELLRRMSELEHTMLTKLNNPTEV